MRKSSGAVAPHRWVDDVMETVAECTRRNCAAELAAVDRLVKAEVGKLHAELGTVTKKQEYVRRMARLRDDVILASPAWHAFMAKFDASGCLAQVQRALVRQVKAQTASFVTRAIVHSRHAAWA
jgi:hypothetical protein